MVFFTTFIQSLIYYHIVMIGGGGYVVKTYPSIDPIVAPPIKLTYKCQSLSPASVSMTLRSRLLYLDYGVWRLHEQGGPIRFVTRVGSCEKYSAESTCNKRADTRIFVIIILQNA